MALTDYKITDAQITSKGVVAAPDTMTGTAAENKRVFDRLIREAVKGDIAGLIDSLVATTAAGELGFAETDEIEADTIQEAIEFLYENGEAGVAKALEYALKSEGYAVGKQNGTEVTSESDYYHNNAKYYSEQASDSADAAAGSASTATTKASEASSSATAASGSASDASTYKSQAETAKTAAQAAQSAAEAAQTSAETAATNAGASAATANTKALEAASSASGAAGSATSAAQSAANAESWAQQVHYPVSYGESQSLTDAQKSQARTNVSAEQKSYITVDGTEYVAKSLLRNRNLLDNPWFTVNQRGQSSYASNGYSVDRWKIDNATSASVTVNSDGTITIANNGAADVNLLQLFEAGSLEDGQYTISCDVVSVSGACSMELVEWTSFSTKIEKTLSAGMNSASGNCTFLSANNPYFMLGIAAGASITVKSVKLEKGSISTLANDTAPNETEELLKCQRYFYRTVIQSYNGTTYIVNGDTRCSFRLPVRMRAVPSVSASISSITVIGLSEGGRFINVTGSNLAVGAPSQEEVRITNLTFSAVSGNVFLWGTNDGFYLTADAEIY